MTHPAKNHDLHGNVPDRSEVALVLLDVISDFEFPNGPELFACARGIAPRIRQLKDRAKKLEIPVIYVNDNFGRWQSNFNKLLEHCLAPEARAREFVELLRPDDDDYFVLKPKHSGFYGTTLEILLHYLQASRLVLTGLTGDMCVMFTAHDAYLRELDLSIPADCVVSCSAKDNEYALAHMTRVLKADTTNSEELDLERLRRRR